MSMDQLATTQFLASWDNAKNYPRNLIKIGPNIGSLKAQETLLNANAVNLFYSKSRVKILEFDQNENIQAKSHVITKDQELLQWLVLPTVTPANAVSSGQGTSGSSTNPSSNTQMTLSTSSIRCRFLFFQAPSSEARLDVSLEMARRILTYFQVMSSYIDFLSVFTVDSRQYVEAVEHRFSGFRERVLLSKPARGLKLPDVALGGRNYQLCYNLKCVALKQGPPEIQDSTNWLWSARQGCFQHQFDLSEGTTSWIITAARDDLRKRVNELTGSEGRVKDRTFKNPAASFISSLAVHLLLAQWATEDWRGYIKWLEQVLEQKTISVMRSSDFVPSSEDVSFVQKKQDETNKAIMMLNANADILSSLGSFYERLMKNPNFDLKDNEECKCTMTDFLLQLHDFSHEFKMHAARATTLGKITADRKNLVQQHLQAYSTEQMKILTSQAQQEAVNMRIIAIMTFLLLPATFVSVCAVILVWYWCLKHSADFVQAFFSTDVVKYQNQNSNDGNTGESYSALAMQRWFEITLPLTFLTLTLACCMLYWEKVKKLSKWLFSCGRYRHPISLSDEEKSM